MNLGTRYSDAHFQAVTAGCHAVGIRWLCACHVGVQQLSTGTYSRLQTLSHGYIRECVPGMSFHFLFLASIGSLARAAFPSIGVVGVFREKKFSPRNTNWEYSVNVVLELLFPTVPSTTTMHLLYHFAKPLNVDVCMCYSRSPSNDPEPFSVGVRAGVQHVLQSGTLVKTEVAVVTHGEVKERGGKFAVQVHCWMYDPSYLRLTFPLVVSPRGFKERLVPENSSRLVLRLPSDMQIDPDVG